MVIGILGGIGSGKSSVARLLVEAGAEAVDADRIAREVISRQEVKDRLRAVFGDGIFGPEGEVDRRSLAAKVFSDGRHLRELNAMIHPEVRERILEKIRAHRVRSGGAGSRTRPPGNGGRVPVFPSRSEGRRGTGLPLACEGRQVGDNLLVLDVALLAESPLREECDGLVFVEAPEEVRRSRIEPRGWPAGELERREAFQTPLPVKRDMATWTIDNSGPPEALRTEVRRLLREIERFDRSKSKRR